MSEQFGIHCSYCVLFDAKLRNCLLDEDCNNGDLFIMKRPTCKGCKYEGTDVLDYSLCDTCARMYPDNYKVVSE